MRRCLEGLKGKSPESVIGECMRIYALVLKS